MAEKASKKKYTLFKAGDPSSGPKACAFFASADGCRNGAKCMFLHEEDGKIIPTQAKVVTEKAPVHTLPVTPSVTRAAPAVKDRAAPVISHQVVTAPVPPAPPVSATKKRKSDEALLYSTHEPVKSIKTPTSRAPVHVPLPSRESDDDEDDDHSLVFGAVDVAINQLTPVAAAMKPKSRKITPEQGSNKVNSSKAVANGALEFRSPNETARVLATSGTAHATQGPRHAAGAATVVLKQTTPSKTQPAINASKVGKSVASPLAAVATPPKPAAPVVASKVKPSAQGGDSDILQEALKLISAGGKTSIAKTPEGPSMQDLIDPRARDWVHLVERTRAHAKFAKDYSFPSSDAGWTKALPNSRRNTSNHPVVAIDCEMCMTVDPVTNQRYPMDLVRFSMIAENEVIVDTLVNPGRPVVDMRTAIHGIEEADLADVKFTLKHAQALMSSYCTEGTVIVGHALYNDLKVLMFDHGVVVDTSYLYAVIDEPGQSPSMRDVSEFILGEDMTAIHDSVRDAEAAYKAAKHLLTLGPITKAPEVPRSQNSSTKPPANSLLVHRIPQGCDEEGIKQMMLSLTAIVPSQVLPLQWVGTDAATQSGKTYVVFPSKEHADFAFEALPGPNRPDKSNRAQKRAYLKTGGYICVRKN